MKSKKKIIDEIVYYVEEAIAQMDDESIEKMTNIQIMPVIRATSFDKKQKKVIVLSLKSIQLKPIFITHLI